MKKLKQYLIESQNFLVNKKLQNRQTEYEYYPKTEDELKDIIVDLLKKGITDLNCIDVSGITDISCLFWSINKRVTVKDIDISKWDVSNVEYMTSMFSGCYDFNSDLSRWNVSKVTNMAAMFEYCTKFNSDLSKWNVSKVTDMYKMFIGCKEFNSDITRWDVSKVTDMYKIFYACDMLKKNNLIPKWYKE